MKRKMYLIPILLFLLPFISFSQDNEVIDLELSSICMDDSIQFSIVNVGNVNLRKELNYYVIEDEIIARQSILDSLDTGDSLNFIFYRHGLEVSLEIDDPNSNKNRMIGEKMTNCGTTYPLVNKKTSGKFNQVVTGKFNDPWAIGIYAGTLGPGATIVRNLGPKLSLRLGGTYLPIQFSTEGFLEESITDINIKLFTVDLKMDYYISKNPKNQFHMIFGGTYNNSSFSTLSRADTESEIILGNQLINSETIGEVDIKITPNKFNVFMGAGIGRLVHHRKRVGLKLELGGLFTGSPNAELLATGTVSPTATQQETLQANLRQYYVYPVINLYLSVKL